MKIKMLETKRIYDGNIIRLLREGREYDLADFDARCLVAEGRAISLEPRKTLEQHGAELIAYIRTARAARLREGSN